MAIQTSALPQVKDAIEQALLKHDITIDSAVAPIAKALKAKRTYYIDGERFVSDDDDLEMQLKGSDRALKLMGAGTKEEVSGNTFNFINNANFDSKKYVK